MLGITSVRIKKVVITRKVRRKGEKKREKKYIKLGKILLGDETKKIISLKNLLFASHSKSLYFFSTTAAHFRDKVILWGSGLLLGWTSGNTLRRFHFFFRFLVPTVIAQAYKAVLRVLPQLSEFHFIPFYFSSKFDFFFLITFVTRLHSMHLNNLSVHFSWKEGTEGLLNSWDFMHFFLHYFDAKNFFCSLFLLRFMYNCLTIGAFHLTLTTLTNIDLTLFNVW